MYGSTDAQIRDDVEEEVTAQYFGVAITRGSIDEFLKTEGEETVRTEKIGFLEKLKEIFKRIAAALQKKLEELAKKDLVAASVMQADVKELQKAVETFDAVLESVKDLSAARTGSAAASAVRAEGAEQNKNTAEGAVKMSKASVPKGYNSPITIADVSSLKSVTTDGQSISEFTQTEIDATGKWAYKYYKQMGVKSPFFRAWADWRAYDQQRVEAANKKGAVRGKTLNKDTGWNINISGKVFDETIVHQNPSAKEAKKYLPYLEDIVSKAVLLDTKALGKSKKENSLFMHSFYAVADIGNGKELLKLYVEEMYDPGAKDDNFRAYKLMNIEKQQSWVMGSQNSVSPTIKTAAVNTVADLYALVKKKDKKFKPGRAVDPILLKDDGTPKVFNTQKTEKASNSF